MANSGTIKKGEVRNPNGRPRKEREVRFYEITLSAVTFEDWKGIVEKAVKQAKTGDAQARKWLSDYLMGTPAQNIDVTTKGEKIAPVQFNYAEFVRDFTPRPIDDSTPPGEDESHLHGPKVG